MRPVIVEFEPFHVFIVTLWYLPVGITATTHCSLHNHIIMFTPFREFWGQPKWLGEFIGVVSVVHCSCCSSMNKFGTLTSCIDLSCLTKDLWVIFISRGPWTSIELGKIILEDTVPLDFSVYIFWYALNFLRNANKLPSDLPCEVSLSLTSCPLAWGFDCCVVISLNALVPLVRLRTRQDRSQLFL